MDMRIKPEPFHELGFSNLKLSLILRGTKQSTYTQTVGKNFFFPKEIAYFTPLGNPPAFYAGYQVINGNAYLTIFHAKNNALHLAANAPTKTRNPIHLLHETKLAMQDLLENVDETTDITFELSGTVPNDFTLLRKLQSSDSLLYNVLIKQNIVIIGNTNDLIQVIKAIISCLPDTYQATYTFQINLVNQNAKIIGIDPEIVEDIQEKIDSLLQSGYDIIDLQSQQVYGEFTTQLAEYIIQLAKEQENRDLLKQGVKDIFNLLSNHTHNIPDKITIAGTPYELTESDKHFLTQIKEVWF